MARDRESVEDLYRRYSHSVVRRARQILGNEHEAADVLHEIFVSLIERPEQFNGKSSAATFLYAATTHLCLNRLRNQRNRARLFAVHVVAGAKGTARPNGEVRAHLSQLLGRLPEDQASAAVYYYYDGMSHAEIAEIMACSPRHVGNLLERMRERIGSRESDA